VLGPSDSIESERRISSELSSREYLHRFPSKRLNCPFPRSRDSCLLNKSTLESDRVLENEWKVLTLEKSLAAKSHDSPFLRLLFLFHIENLTECYIRVNINRFCISTPRRDAVPRSFHLLGHSWKKLATLSARNPHK